MWPIVIALIVVLALLGRRKAAFESKTAGGNTPSKPKKPKRKPVPVWSAPYVDGNLGADTGALVFVGLQEKGILVSWNNVTQHAHIPFGRLDRVVTKSEEDIHRDVTLGRLLIFGVLAFGMKKNHVTRRTYTVIRGKDTGSKAVYAILEVDSRWQIARASEKINDARQKYRNEHSNEVEELPEEGINVATPPSIDPLDQIGRLKTLLDNGAITREEFNAKKTELLNRT